MPWTGVPMERPMCRTGSSSGPVSAGSDHGSVDDAPPPQESSPAAGTAGAGTPSRRRTRTAGHSRELGVRVPASQRHLAERGHQLWVEDVVGGAEEEGLAAEHPPRLDERAGEPRGILLAELDKLDVPHDRADGKVLLDCRPDDRAACAEDDDDAGDAAQRQLPQHVRDERLAAERGEHLGQRALIQHAGAGGDRDERGGHAGGLLIGADRLHLEHELAL
eukprot:scaffold2325_cov105-Isochrysis_galbana.AAC.11